MAAPPITERHLAHFHRRAPVKEPVRFAATANVNTSTGLNVGDTVDGGTLADGDRVLLPVQTAPAENGLWIAGAVPVRAYDQSTDDPAFGFLVRVREGTANAGKVYANTNTATPTIGTTGLTFAALPSTDLTGIDFLVGTATGLLSGEIVAGTTPGGELGNTWASPTVDASHSGSTHAAAQAAAEATAAAALAAHIATGGGEILISDTPSTPLVFADLVQNEAQTDLVYSG